MTPDPRVTYRQVGAQGVTGLTGSYLVVGPERPTTMVHCTKVDRKSHGKSLPKSGPKSGPNSGTSTYATSQDVAAYLDTMRRRAGYLARRGEPGRVYLSVNPYYTTADHWPKTLKRLRQRFSPARVQCMADVWTGDAGAGYASGWDEYADTLTGLVVFTGRLAIVGRGMVREITSAQERGLPILINVPGRQVPLVDCRTTPMPGGSRSKALQIELPASSPRPTATLTACLAAMGVKR